VRACPHREGNAQLRSAVEQALLLASGQITQTCSHQKLEAVVAAACSPTAGSFRRPRPFVPIREGLLQHCGATAQHHQGGREVGMYRRTFSRRCASSISADETEK